MALGPQELLVIFGLALLLFGPQKIPQFAQALGQAHAKYRQGLNQVSKSITEGTGSDTDPALTPEEQEIIRAAKAKGIPTEHRSIEAIAQDLLNSS